MFHVKIWSTPHEASSGFLAQTLEKFWESCTNTSQILINSTHNEFNFEEFDQ